MKLHRSIRFRLSLMLILVFALVVLFGLFSLSRLADYHAVAADLHDRHLVNTQFLGELNDLTSARRTAEATALLSQSPQQARTNDEQIAEIDRRLVLLQNDYQALRNGPEKAALYQDFADKWVAYRVKAQKVMDLAADRRLPEAAALYDGESHDAYDAAADSLWILNEKIREAAREASRRASAAYDQALWLTGGALVAAALLLSGGAFFLRRSVLSPLSGLALAMRRLAVNDLSFETPDHGRQDEIGELERAIQVFRRNAIELDAKLALEQRLNAAQRNFVSMASHEFRTPLTIIDGHAQRLINRGERADATEVGERAGKIRQAVARMTGVIGNLLDSARLVEQDGALPMEPVECDLGAMLHEVCGLYREIAPRIVIEEKIENRPLRVTGDAKLLFQLFSNLLSNAAKYSPDLGTVTVSARQQAERLVVEIADRGVGIPAQDRDRLFERYFRGSNVSGIVGTGLGLHLVKMVAELHGGDVAVTSREGEGSSFSVSLPMLAL